MVPTPFPNLTIAAASMCPQRVNWQLNVHNDDNVHEVRVSLCKVSHHKDIQVKYGYTLSVILDGNNYPQSRPYRVTSGERTQEFNADRAKWDL
jgi:hypothetical protein